MPSHYDRYSVLLKLSSGTVTALQNAGIRCLEELFGRTEDEIFEIYGIDSKRGREILELLHNLPFDYTD